MDLSQTLKRVETGKEGRHLADPLIPMPVADITNQA